MSIDKKNNDKKGEKKKSSKEDFPIQEYRLIPDNKFDSTDNNKDEIDILELVRVLWGSRKIIFRFGIVGVLLGISLALFIPKEYVSFATLMPEYNTESASGGASRLLQQYGGLIGLSGGTYNSASNAIRVDLYPEIVASLSFQDKLARQEFYFSEYDTTVSIYKYYLDIKSAGFFGTLSKYTIGLPGVIKKSIKGEEDKSSIGSVKNDEIVRLSKRQMDIINILRERVTVNLNEESGIISVSAKMSDPELAAEVAKFTVEELTSYLTDYRTEKVQRDLDYIEEQLQTAEERFEVTQFTLAEFRDSNQGTLTARARTEEQRLNSEYDVAFNVYNTLTQQYEEAKLKVQEETPVFKVLQPVQVPVNDNRSGVMVLFSTTLLMLAVAIVFVYLKNFFSLTK